MTDVVICMQDEANANTDVSFASDELRPVQEDGDLWWFSVGEN